MLSNMLLQLLLNVFILLLLLRRKPSAPGFISGVAGAKIKCIDKERQALLKFKLEVLDDHGVLSSWSGHDCCLWQGVGCDNTSDHVTILDLHVGKDDYCLLQGDISNSLLELRHLNYLDLSNNMFMVSLPSFIGSLTELKHLNLSRNTLVGTLPYQLGNLSKLQTLDLSFNDNVYFQSLGWLSRLSSLEHLDLSWNDLTNARDWLQGVNNLPRLRNLHLRGCSLSTIIPSSLSFTNHSKSLSVVDLSVNNLTSSIFIPRLYNFSNSLVDIDLSYNLLDSVPDAFKNMIFLESLLLSSNYLQGIPRIFGDMCNLHALDLSHNNLNGVLSESIQNLYGCIENSLQVLSLGGNQLYGLLPDITRFSSMRELDLSRNQLNGSLPDRFSQCSNLHSLNLHRNKFTGSLPDLTTFPSLNLLWIGDNQLDGMVSETIGSLSVLEDLDISQNSLRGTLYETHFSNLTKLRNLDLSCNADLTLGIPDDWIPPFQLDSLNLRSCNLGPHFPIWFQTQTNISQLDISSARISDTIPNWFWDFSPNLKFINLSHNQMTGRLPNDLSSRYASFIGFDLSANNFEGPLPLFPSKTTSLDLSKNMFSGSISMICDIVDNALIFLDLSNNLLSGSIPDCFMDFEDLFVLNLGNNNLSGEIPNSIGSLLSLQTLSLCNNNLHGELPSLKNCSSLRFLDLSENRFSGEIPSWIGESISILAFLSLQSNEFFGSIPPHLCQLKYIHILDLSLNNLSGAIPKCLNNSTAMVEKPTRESTNIEHIFYMTISTGETDGRSYISKAFVEWKGREHEYGKNLGLLRLIDFAGNKLSGEIPEEIADLLSLMALNLSRNQLSGVIPQRIGQLTQLESLDLSRNQLLGAIPMMMANLNFLNHLDLSYNELSGKIPSSTQLQSFDASAFAGNLALCGLPLTPTCPRENMPPTNGDNEEENVDDKFKEWFCMGLVTGFSASFCGVFAALVLKSSRRRSFFPSLE